MAIIPDSCRVDPAKQKMPATPPPEIAAKKPPACEAGIGCICRGTVLHKKIDIPPCERNCPTSKGSNLPNHQCFYQDEVVTPEDQTCCCHGADTTARYGDNPGGKDQCNPCPLPPLSKPCKD